MLTGILIVLSWILCLAFIVAHWPPWAVFIELFESEIDFDLGHFSVIGWANSAIFGIYSKTSITRARIAWIPDRSNTLADSMFSLQFWTHIIVVGAIFTCQNRPKCKFYSHFGRFRLIKMVPTTSSYQSLTVLCNKSFQKIKYSMQYIQRYTFICRYIYVPCGGSRAGLHRQIIASLICFMYIFYWHGAEFYILMWIVLNYIGVSLEKVGSVLCSIPIVKYLEVNIFYITVESRYLELGYLKFCKTRRVYRLYLNQKYILMAFSTPYLALGTFLQVKITRSAN